MRPLRFHSWMVGWVSRYAYLRTCLLPMLTRTRVEDINCYPRRPDDLRRFAISKGAPFIFLKLWQRRRCSDTKWMLHLQYERGDRMLQMKRGGTYDIGADGCVMVGRTRTCSLIDSVTSLLEKTCSTDSSVRIFSAPPYFTNPHRAQEYFDNGYSH